MASKLQTLIQELCPDGVEYVKIKDVFTRLRGTPITAGKMKEIASPLGDITIFAGGKTVVKAFESDLLEANVIRRPAVLVQSRGIIDFIYSDQPFTFKNEMWAYAHESQTYVKFLYYVLKNNVDYFRDAASGMGSLPQISLPVTEEFKIPVPPLPVQAEIVRILDVFTELTAALTAELTARKKQYEYYRDWLLTFDDSVERVRLGEVILSLNTGLNPRQFFKLNTPNAKNYYITIREIINGYIVPSDKTDRIDDRALMLCNGRSNLEKDDVLFSGTGTIGETAIIQQAPLNWNIKEGVYSLKPNQMFIFPKYLRYILTSTPTKQEYMKRAFGGTVKSVSMEELRKIQIPLPSLVEQRRIVSILDRFEALCNDLTSGLPAEIAARKKQYEYYRDKLLTFRARNAAE